MKMEESGLAKIKAKAEQLKAEKLEKESEKKEAYEKEKEAIKAEAELVEKELLSAQEELKASQEYMATLDPETLSDPDIKAGLEGIQERYKQAQQKFNDLVQKEEALGAKYFVEDVREEKEGIKEEAEEEKEGGGKEKTEAENAKSEFEKYLNKPHEKPSTRQEFSLELFKNPEKLSSVLTLMEELSGKPVLKSEEIDKNRKMDWRDRLIDAENRQFMELEKKLNNINNCLGVLGDFNKWYTGAFDSKKEVNKEKIEKLQEVAKKMVEDFISEAQSFTSLAPEIPVGHIQNAAKLAGGLTHHPDLYLNPQLARKLLDDEEKRVEMRIKDCLSEIPKNKSRFFGPHVDTSYEGLEKLRNRIKGGNKEIKDDISSMEQLQKQ
jgi:hypothetical protein